MLRIFQQSDSGTAKGYYGSRAETGYYAGAEQEMVGSFGGKAAERLGLFGQVDRRSFDRLCDNRHPDTGEKLTARMRQGRRVGYDFNFHPPKSVSLLYGLTADPAILRAFRLSVADAMREIESGVAVRVRKGGRCGERVSGNAVWAEFVHFTARPVAGVIDPHLHSHIFLLNASFDPVEGIWKAIDVASVKRQGMEHQKRFLDALARRLEAAGYAIRREGKAFEIAGIDRALIEKFSGRTAQVEAFAARHGITDPAEKDRIGARTREHKRSDASMDTLRKEWEARLSNRERDAVEAASMRRRFTGERPFSRREWEALNARHLRQTVPEAGLPPGLLRRQQDPGGSLRRHARRMARLEADPMPAPPPLRQQRPHVR